MKTFVPTLVGTPKPVIKMAAVPPTVEPFTYRFPGAAELFKANETPSVIAPWPWPLAAMVKIPGFTATWFNRKKAEVAVAAGDAGGVATQAHQSA